MLLYSPDSYLHLLLLASFLFLTATVLDISLVGQRPSTDASHINPQSYLAAIAFGLAHSTLYLWLFCVIVNKRSFDMFEEKPTNLSLQDLAGQAKARLRVTLALRMLAGLLLLPITILEVAWRIALLCSLRTGVLLHRSCCVTELLLLGIVWLPLMAQIMVGTARMGALGSAWHWIAVFFLVAGCGIEIGDYHEAAHPACLLAEADRTLTFNRRSKLALPLPSSSRPSRSHLLADYS